MPVPLPVIPTGTQVRWAPSARLFGARYLGGGAPWRLVKLSGIAIDAVARWQRGGDVRSGDEALARTLCDAGLLLASYEIATPTVDIVIPYAGHPRDAERLATQCAGHDVTLVRDGVGQAARHENLVNLEENRGPGAARNAGAARGERDLILFLDDDVTVDDIDHLVNTLASHFIDPTVSAVAPRIVGSDDPSTRGRFERDHSPLDLGALSARVHPQGAVAYVPSAALMVRRSHFTGFDETLRTGEDVDFIWRLIAGGSTVIYDARICVRHRARSSWSTWLSQRVSYGQSASALATRHPEAYAALRLDATLTGGLVSMALAPLRSVLGIWSTLERRYVRQLPDDPEVARELARFAMWHHSRGLARGLMRSYLPLVMLALIPQRTRRLATLIIGLSFAGRVSSPRDLRDVPLMIADDAAYSTGVWRGVWRAKSLAAVRPAITWPSERRALKSE